MESIDVGKKVTRLIYTKYNKDRYMQEEINTIDGFLKDDGEYVKWLDIVGLSDQKVLDSLVDKLGIHPLTIEDISNMDQIPKVEVYEDSLIVIAKNIILGEELEKEQISFVLYDDKLISFRFKETGVFDGIKNRLRDGTVLRKSTPDRLLYALLDIVVDKYFIVMENIGEKIDILEDETLENPDESILEKVYLLKRDLIAIRNILWPMRNTISSISKNEYQLISANTVYYFRDIYDHIIQTVEINETYREIASSMLEIYLSSISNKTNDVMKILTIYSTIFIPLTFIAGIYGMNFKYMPELYWKYSYLGFWIISIAIIVYMIRFFKKRDWI